MNKNVDEFIDKNGALISGSEKPNVNMKTTSAQTTDQHVNATRQGTVWMNYRRYYGEAELPYNKVADKYQKNPKKFWDYLKKKDVTGDFEKYFEKIPEGELTNEGYLAQVVEDVLSKKVDRGVVSTRVFEDLNSDQPFIGKCVSRLCELMQDLDDGDKELILGYIRDNG